MSASAFTDNPQSELQALIARFQPYLSRVIAVMNGKGGVGKTTTSAHLAALMAERCAYETPDERVLVIELDDQANLGVYLGYAKTERDDRGAGLEASVLRREPARVIRDVRPNLDVIPCGELCAALNEDILARVAQDETAWLRLAELIATIAHEYAWIIIDCPPKSRNLLRLALHAARWVLIPLDFSKFARDGMQQVAQNFSQAKLYNPALELLGVLMYNFTTERVKKDGAATGLVVRARERAQNLLEGYGIDDKLFLSYIRQGTTVIEQAQEGGCTVIELQRAKGSATKWYERARGTTTELAVERAGKIIEDFENLANEVIDRVAEAEAEDDEFDELEEVEIPAQQSHDTEVAAS